MDVCQHSAVSKQQVLLLLLLLLLKRGRLCFNESLSLDYPLARPEGKGGKSK